MYKYIVKYILLRDWVLWWINVCIFLFLCIPFKGYGVLWALFQTRLLISIRYIGLSSGKSRKRQKGNKKVELKKTFYLHTLKYTNTNNNCNFLSKLCFLKLFLFVLLCYNIYLFFYIFFFGWWNGWDLVW